MTEREVVYTVHKFQAENVDEISINVGEKVIVLGKDEGYNDGWWQGRNVRGETGLFPVTYTVKQPPATILENKIESLESKISKMRVPSTNSKMIQNNVNKSLIENKSPVEEWSAEQVANWLINIGFDQQLANDFKDQEITGDILLELTLDSLKELQVTTFGKRFKIHSAINILRQEYKKQKLSITTTTTNTTIKSTEPRVTSPYPDAPANNYYNNKQQPYADDDLVSDYSTVIRNSHLPSPTNNSRPTLPLDMDLIASSPNLTTLVERHNSISSVRTNNTDRTQRQVSRTQPPVQQQQARTQPPVQQQQARTQPPVQQQQARTQPPVQQQQARTQPPVQQQLQQQPQVLQPQIHPSQRPISHQTIQPTTNGSSEWRRNTMNNMKLQEKAEEPKATTTRYSFMRGSLLPNHKLQSVIPNTNMVRRSEDVSTLAEVSISPDMEGWLFKQGDKYKTWNKRWFVLKSNNLFYFKSPKAVRMKGIINLKGYRIEVDESIHPGNYCFKAHHERERTFYFYTEFEKPMKDWLKALMKATIARDYATPVMSSSTIPTISLELARKMRPRPPSTIFLQKDATTHSRSPSPGTFHIHNNLDQQFSMMALEEQHDVQPIIPFSQLNDNIRSRAPSSMSNSTRRVMSPETTSSDYASSRLKDSGFNSSHGANLSRSITECSSNSSTHKTTTSSSSKSERMAPSVIFYPDEEQEDLIDPEHMSVIEVNRLNVPETLYRHAEEEEGEEEEEELFTTTVMKKQQRYVDWVNSHLQKTLPIRHISELRSGEALLELLESLSQQEIMRPIINPSQSENVCSMDRVITAFKFMSSEGIDLDGACTVRDILNANSDKIMYMLDSIKYWNKSNPNNTKEPGKKMASGGTFGEDDQCKLRELETESILPPNQHTFPLR